jgi:hypothetical protein
MTTTARMNKPEWLVMVGDFFFVKRACGAKAMHRPFLASSRFLALLLEDVQDGKVNENAARCSIDACNTVMVMKDERGE